MADDDLLAALRLNAVPGVGPRLQALLLERFETPQRVLEATGRELLEVDGIGPKLSVAITQARQGDFAESELARCRELGIDILERGGERYPSALIDICDPPLLLYRRGELRPVDELAFAIVGTRHATHYGRQQAEKFAAGLARAGFTIISGLARGIDAAAHRGALAAGGRTIAVCATGLNQIYPPEHAGLANEVAASGALLSESPLDRGPLRGLFPQRNRIISGLCRGVLIVEASRKSGSLHTARHAQEQGREVFAIPGQIDNPECHGCLDLLRDGVTLVRSIDDILEEHGERRGHAHAARADAERTGTAGAASDRNESATGGRRTRPAGPGAVARTGHADGPGNAPPHPPPAGRVHSAGESLNVLTRGHTLSA
jgi:DNA processing protein